MSQDRSPAPATRADTTPPLLPESSRRRSAPPASAGPTHPAVHGSMSHTGVAAGDAASYASCSDIHGGPPAAISTRTLDAQVWARVEEVLANPEVIANEVARLQECRSDRSQHRCAGQAHRGGRAPAHQPHAADCDHHDDEICRPVLIEIQALGAQQLQRERDDVEAERRGWQRARTPQRSPMVVPRSVRTTGQSQVRARTPRAVRTPCVRRRSGARITTRDSQSRCRSISTGHSVIPSLGSR